MSKIYSTLRSTGSYLPTKIVSNAALAQTLDTSDEWIVSRTGIRQRHIADPLETTVSMGIAAAKQALSEAGLEPEAVELIVVATSTAEKLFPSSACMIQAGLGIHSHCAAFDLQAACSGFMYGLSVVDQFIRSGQIKCALLIGSEIMSRILDWNDRSTCVLFGDGAGAVLLEASHKPGIIGTRLGAEGRHQEVLYVDKTAGSTLKMQGSTLYKLAIPILDQALKQILNDYDRSVSQVDWLIPHQANVRMLQSTAKQLGLRMDQVIVTLDQQANTSAASIPLALDWGIRTQKIKRGDTLLLEGIGGGLTWGTALIDY